VEKDRLGNCHDQAFYAASYLRKMGYEPELYFMIEYSGRYVHDAGTTHTLVCYKKDDKYYWLENAWGDHAGIHGPYDSTADIRRQVEAWWPKNRKYQKFYFGCIDIDSGDTVPFGVDLDDYVGFCLPKKLLGESSGCDELLDEILFPDTDDTKYWEQDDEKFKKRVEKSDQEIAADSPADLAESVLQYHDWISQATHPARQLSENIADLDRMLTEASYRDRNNPHHWKPTNETGVVRNDKGAVVPNTCPVCGSDVKIFFRGEPVYLCSNKKCEKFFGVVPFHENAEAVWPPDGPYTITRLCMNDEIVGDRRTADTLDGAVRNVLDDPNCASESKVTPGIPWYLHSVVDGSLCCIGKIDILDADGNWKWIEKWDPETGGLLQETSMRSELDPNFKPRGKWDLVEFTQVTLTKDELKKHLDEPGWEMLKHVRHDEEKTSTVGWIDDEDKLVALVSVSYPGGTRSKASGKYNWITALGVRGDYRGCGLGKQVLDYAVKKLGGDALGVAYNNRVAQAMYTKYGFKRSKDSERAVDTKQSRRPCAVRMTSPRIPPSRTSMLLPCPRTVTGMPFSRASASI